MEKAIKFIPLFLLLILPRVSMGDDVEQKSRVLQKLMSSFEKICVGPNGAILDNVVVVDREGIVQDGRAINCGDEARRLGLMLQDLKVAMKGAKSEKAADSVKCAGAIDPMQSVMPPDNGLVSVAEHLRKKVNELQCKKQSSDQCVKDLYCNVLRSTGFDGILKLYNSVKKSQELAECTSARKGSCLSEALVGVFKQLWGNLDGAWTLAKMGAKGAKNVAIGAWRKLTGVEDKTSDAALMASKQTDSGLALFKKSPAKFMKGLIANLWDSAGNSIKTNFGCEKWDGVPHISNCIKEMSSWDCATCDQRVNAVCGVAGVLGGEAITWYLTGGATAVAKAGAKSGAAGLLKLNQVVTKAIPRIAKVEEALIVPAKMVKRVVLAAVELGEKVINSEMAKKIAAFTKKSTSPVLRFTERAARTAAVKITFKVVEGVTSPVTGYMNLLEKSFAVGFSQGERSIGSAGSSLTKFSDYLAGDKVIKSTEDVTVLSSGKLSHEEILLKLNESKVPFEEILLPGGKKEIKIKLDPSCGSSGLIIR